MKDLRRISWFAILLLVVLRVAIGWQLLYEGMWKYGTMSGPDPWTAEGYLKNAQGPFRDHFREMTGDPDDLNWLDYDKMSSKWYSWRDRFANHYQLSPEQKAVLDILIDADADADTAPSENPPFPPISVPLAALPESVNLKSFARVVEFDNGRLVALAPILPSEEAKLKKLVSYVPGEAKAEDGDAVDPKLASEMAFYKSVETLSTYSRRPIEAQLNQLSRESRRKDSELDADNLSAATSKLNSAVKRELPFRHRLAASLLGDPDNTGVIGRLNERGSFDYVMGTVTRQEEDEARHNVRFGKIEEYKKLLDEYEDTLTNASMQYQTDHASMLSRKVAMTRNELVGPIRSLEKELQTLALKILTPEQLSRGGLPPEDTPLYRADMMAMWGLLILGSLIIVGLFTRLSAFAAAFMVFSFYLVVPPWPGVPPAPGPEHSFIVNKNLIEVLALLAIAALPTGQWFGIDGFVSRLFFGSSDSDGKKAAEK
ncbi:DoxX [Thalassoglobus neptunius]|uniref:DoxX n=1 Tax=Thalassoglobus neptunius TaxID=1938619 RepID=A0A5C5X1K8_9PLAN|nr:DoxX family protein [Thalassoglobus neptunius]TWT57014.1 DoxX [Thalassoglobus neptunius]